MIYAYAYADAGAAYVDAAAAYARIVKNFTQLVSTPPPPSHSTRKVVIKQEINKKFSLTSIGPIMGACSASVHPTVIEEIQQKR